MSVIKFNRNFSELFNWDSDADPTTEQEYQGAVKNWTETEMNIVDTLLWQPETDYTEENIVKTPSLPLHYVLVCTTGGTSGATEPSYDNVQIGDSVTDGTVEWTVTKLAVGDIPVVSDRAKVDASNIGVNAETDNSELWGSAIGGGEIAEDDGKLVTGGTVYAVTSGLASDIADNTDDIATNTENISQNATDIGIADKRISNIEKLLQGNLYDYQTDSDTAYTKTVPSGAMPYAGLGKVGGKTIVFNQLVNTGTTSVATISGHKYYTLIDGTASIVTADGTAITIVDDTADMVCDLTLMFGSGNEPSTADFTEIYPASYYAYNAGTLLSAGVTEVESVGKNLLNLKAFADSYPSYCSWNHETQTLGVTAWDSILFTTGIAVNYPAGYTAKGTVTNGTSINARFDFVYEDGTVAVINMNTSTLTFTKRVVKARINASTTGTMFFKDFQVENNDSATSYVPYNKNTFPIPTAIRNLEGYGWSAGGVYNYIDYERKVYVKNVDRVDLGSLDWIYYSYSGFSGGFSYGINTLAKKTATGNDVGNILTPITVTLSDNDFNSNNDGRNISITIVATIKITVPNVTDSTTLKSALNGVYAYYELATPVETDISEYLTDDNLIQVESGGTLTFPNSNGTDYQIPVPSEETYMIDLQEAINNG